MLTILVVDDEAPLRAAVREILEINGYQVVEACDGLEAFQVFVSSDIGLVITDMVMPNLDGIGFITKLRESFPFVPILTMSGGTRIASEGQLATDVYENERLAKPFTAAELLKKVAKLTSEVEL
jgi:CheY-like chemotaxis protein